MAHAPLAHTADTGIEATAPSLTSLIAELATGMFGLMAGVDPCPDEPILEATVEASTNEDIVVDALSELLYMSEIEDLHFCRFEVTESRESTVHMTVWGVPRSGIELIGPPIKAVTYHQLEISVTEEGWHARVYFDV